MNSIKTVDIVTKDKADKLLELARKRDTIDEAAKHAYDARVHILASIDTLGDLEEPRVTDYVGNLAARNSLRAALRDLDDVDRDIRRMRGNVNRSIANVGRSK